MSDDLEPITPERAVQLYLDHRAPDLADKTLQNQRYRLTRFIEWAAERELENINTLSGRDLHEFRSWRSQEVKTVTLVNELRTLQKFLEFCATIEAVEDGLRERVLIPELSDSDEARDVQLDDERAREILKHLNRFAYASREHATLLLLWHTGIRLGTLRSIDVDDVDLEGRTIHLRHRPESGTPLKNGERAERHINVSSRYCEILADYIEHTRHDVVDEYGRIPLITSEQGRLTATPIRRMVYRVTQPCFVGDCPHDEDPDTCDYLAFEKLSQCPSSRSPHAIRRGSITHHLRMQTPQDIVQDRCNVSDEVLEKHYDERDEREKAQARRQWLNDVFESNT